jgi:hypothetical protein
MKESRGKGTTQKVKSDYYIFFSHSFQEVFHHEFGFPNPAVAGYSAGAG